MLTDRPIRFLQVARILSPIINCLDNLETLVDTDQGIRALIDEGFGYFFGEGGSHALFIVLLGGLHDVAVVAV